MDTLLIIDNESRAAAGGSTFERVSPVTGTTVTTAAAASIDDANAAAEAAARAYQTWSKVPNSERRRLLLKAADIIESKMDEFIVAMKAEIGASELWIRINVVGAANLFREAATLANQIQGETLPTERAGALSMTIRQPVGVVLSIVPWNGPVVLAARAIAYPLVCGNTVLFRASEISPKTHRLIAEAVVEAGVTPGALNFITNSSEDSAGIIDALIEHKAVRRINFTGSTRVGRIIAEKAARQLKRCILELGDKSPVVVLDDANLQDAANAIAFGTFLYQGQICMSTDRLIVDEKVADELVHCLAEKVRLLPAGDPVTTPNCIVGPVITKEAGARLNGLIRDALSLGAKLVLGGPGDGAMIPATILDSVTPDMRIYREETFGPVLSVIRASDADDALRIANDSDYGLSASVFGGDVSRAIGIALQIESGSVHVNGSSVQNEPQAPYGGMKHSGYGRFDGRAVVEEFTELKWLTIEPSGQTYPF